MKIYLAPLQGLTDWIFRESYAANIGSFDKTFSPFIRVQNGVFYRPAQCNDILPAHNTFQQTVPQFLGNESTSFARFEELCLQNGYTEVNINMGCPFPVVVQKGMGAGILPNPGRVSALLKDVFAKTTLKVSIKCRLGHDSATEFEEIIPILNDYPLTEVILHPRIGKQQYKGEVDMNAFTRYVPLLKHPVCYNGDITRPEDVTRIQSQAPQVDRIMIGRGILQDPFLLTAIRGQQLTPDEKKRMLLEFHKAMIEYSKQKYSGDLHILRRFEELWSYHALGFENGRKIYKQVKKSKTLAQYETAVLQALSVQS